MQRLFGSLWFWTAFVAIGFAIWLSGAIGYRAPSAPPVLAELPEFSLIDERGETVTDDSLRGAVWVLALLPSSDSDEAKQQGRWMSKLQRRVVRVKERLFLVSLATDARDGPAELEAHARNQAAHRARWRFLSGEKAKVDELIAALPSEGSIMLVDHEARVRGVYSTDDEGARAILRDMGLILGLEIGPQLANKST